jgi:hypothetical protein
MWGFVFPSFSGTAISGGGGEGDKPKHPHRCTATTPQSHSSLALKGFNTQPEFGMCKSLGEDRDSGETLRRWPASGQLTPPHLPSLTRPRKDCTSPGDPSDATPQVLKTLGGGDGPGAAGLRGCGAGSARRTLCSPGQGLRRCFSSSDSSSRNSNQQVCGGVQGRLEVAASRSAASALILPPPPLPPGPLPASNLTLGSGASGPVFCGTGQRNDHNRNVPETHTAQDGGAGHGS